MKWKENSFSLYQTTENVSGKLFFFKNIFRENDFPRK